MPREIGFLGELIPRSPHRIEQVEEETIAQIM